MTTHTDDDTVVAEAIFTLIDDNKIDLQLDDVLYGNHDMIPRASAAIVKALGHNRSLAGVSAPGGRTQNTLIVMIDMLWSKVGDEATERRNCDARGKLLENLIHTDTTLGGIVIHGFVVNVDRGETRTSNQSMFRSVQLMYNATTKTYLSPPAAP